MLRTLYLINLKNLNKVLIRFSCIVHKAFYKSEGLNRIAIKYYFKDIKELKKCYKVIIERQFHKLRKISVIKELLKEL